MGRKYLGFVLGVLLLISLYFFYLTVYRQETEPMTEAYVTNTESTLYDADTQIAILKNYEEMYRAMSDNVLEEDYGMIVLPGLETTRTLSSDQDDKISICTSMTPQGLCVTEKYLLVSAYCHTHSHNSVIYVIDKYTKEFVKEIVLPGKKHVGGLAYDTKHHMIWVSTGYSGRAEVSAFPLDAIISYDLDKEKVPIDYKQEYELYTLERDSYMTYAEEYLYVGHFSLKATSVVQKFKVDEKGGLKIRPGIDIGIEQEIAIPEEIKQIPERIQGIAIRGNKVILTQSYGWSPSKLYVYEYSDFMHHTGTDYTLKEIDMPQKLEQIYIDGNDLYVLFESAAYAYRAQPLPKVDRICKLSLDEVLKL